MRERQAENERQLQAGGATGRGSPGGASRGGSAGAAIGALFWRSGTAQAASQQPADGLIPCVDVCGQVRVAVSMIGVEVVRTYGHMGAAIYCEM
jgi:hypothetical protein